MEQDDEIRNLLLEIIGAGVLRARAAGWEGNAKQCAVEADHIHNLPRLVETPTTELLHYYFDVERASFIRAGQDTTVFEPIWQRLGKLLERTQGPGAVAS